MTLDTRWEDVDTLLQRNSRTKNEKLIHAVQQIAEARFKYPTPEHASYRAYVNLPDVTMAVQAGRDELAPEIVVVERINTGDTELRITASVVDIEQVNEAEAQRHWACFAQIPDQAFYLYVPVGYGARAKQICRRLKIRPEGFRTWRTTPRGFEVNDISGPPGAFDALMPGFVRRALATP